MEQKKEAKKEEKRNEKNLFECDSIYIDKPVVQNLPEVATKCFPEIEVTEQIPEEGNELIERSRGRWRYEYLHSLMVNRIWLPTMQRKTHQTLIIFDYDDTLFCTSYVQPPNLGGKEIVLSPSSFQLIREMGLKVAKLLELSLSIGETFIITNAIRGWVEYSAKKYIPDIAPLLSKIKVISARSEFATIFPYNSEQWKIHAFLMVYNETLIDMPTNIIAISDSSRDISAAHNLASAFNNKVVKTIKCREAPSPKELGKQLDLVRMKLQEIYSSPKSLNITLARKGKQPPSKKQENSYRKIFNVRETDLNYATQLLIYQ